jgi:hypothetical protein
VATCNRCDDGEGVLVQTFCETCGPVPLCPNCTTQHAIEVEEEQREMTQADMTAFSPENGGHRSCPCIYCSHNAEHRCGCQPCTWIRQQFGEDFHKENR